MTEQLEQRVSERSCELMLEDTRNGEGLYKRWDENVLADAIRDLQDARAEITRLNEALALTAAERNDARLALETAEHERDSYRGRLFAHQDALKDTFDYEGFACSAINSLQCLRKLKEDCTELRQREADREKLEKRKLGS